MMLGCTLEISFLGVLGGTVVSVMVGSGFVGFMFRSMRIYFSQDYSYRLLKNSREYNICSVSEGLRSYLTTMKLCSESTKVCEMLATLLASGDVKASLVCGSFKRLEW